jgi:preprotein translocase subunit SecG
MTVLFYISLFLFMLLCVILCFSILIQEAKSLGLGASFGGDSGDSLFGTSTAEVLKKFPSYVAIFF